MALLGIQCRPISISGAIGGRAELSCDWRLAQIGPGFLWIKPQSCNCSIGQAVNRHARSARYDRCRV